MYSDYTAQWAAKEMLTNGVQKVLRTKTYPSSYNKASYIYLTATTKVQSQKVNSLKWKFFSNKN